VAMKLVCPRGLLDLAPSQRDLEEVSFQNPSFNISTLLDLERSLVKYTFLFNVYVNS